MRLNMSWVHILSSSLASARLAIRHHVVKKQKSVFVQIKQQLYDKLWHQSMIGTI